jgi:two-component system cell cycle response regulator
MAGRILVVDDVPTNRMLMTHLLQKAYYEVETAASGAEALAMARRNPPDLALLDVMMPGMDGYELCRKMRADPRLADTPIVMITTLDAVTDRRAGIQAGADDFLTKPVREVALYARLRSLLRMKAMREELRLRDETSRELGIEPPGAREIEPPPGACVLNISSAAAGDRLKATLESRLDVRVATVTTAKETFEFIARQAPEAVLVDAINFKGFSSDFCTALRQRPETRSAALLTIVDADDVRTAAASLDAGANDYLMWPIDPTELSTRLRTQLLYKAHADFLRNSVRDGLRLAVTDPLTGLRNRRYMEAHLRRMVEQARETGAALSMLAFDLDRFKSVNDRHGHAAGDAVLAEFAKRLLANTRSVDLVARIGGEEFVVAMPDANLDDARAAAERVRQAVENPDFEAERKRIPVTVSVGVAALRPDDADGASLLARADSALFIAKSAGRNRVILEAA